MASPNRPEEARSDERMTAWMAEYGPALRRYFGRSVGAAEAEDLVQEVFLAMQVRGAHETVENASGYLFRIAANLLAKRRQKEPWHWDRHVALDGVYEPREEISPERSLIAKQTAAGVLTALKALPPRTAEAFLLHRFEEPTYAAVAKRLGISPKRAEKLIGQALKRVHAVAEGRP